MFDLDRDLADGEALRCDQWNGSMSNANPSIRRRRRSPGPTSARNALKPHCVSSVVAEEDGWVTS